MGYDYRFSEDWFSLNIDIWLFHLGKYINQECHALEIGCYEGRATTWLLDNILINKKSSIEVIDTFGGSSWETGMSHIRGYEEKIYSNFMHNMHYHQNKVKINVGESGKILKTINKEFDIIYIDGSHRAPDVLTDAVLAHDLLKQGGIVIFDDYLWQDPQNLLPENSPKLAIDCFYNVFCNYYEIIHSAYQIMMTKK